jgi:hypothetical protein
MLRRVTLQKLQIAPHELRMRGTARLLSLRRREPFFFAGECHRYFFHHYNTTWLNERTIEIPLASRVLQRHRGERTLEVGNVLSNYLDKRRYSPRHEIIDKYEPAPGVRNIDVMEHQPAAQYGLIVSISTVEHVGWDEAPRDTTKAVRAIELMRRWLAPGGELFVTFPLGHHPTLDRSLVDGTQLFDRLGFMRRVDAENRWVEAQAAEVRGARYGSPYPFANAIAVGLSTS